MPVEPVPSVGSPIGVVRMSVSDGASGAIHLGPVVMRHRNCSACRPEWAYGGGSLWLYDVGTPSVAEVAVPGGVAVGAQPPFGAHGVITEMATGFPGYGGLWPREAACVAEVLQANGYSRATFGKWHDTPDHELSAAGPFDRWPTARGLATGSASREGNRANGTRRCSRTWHPLNCPMTTRVGISRRRLPIRRSVGSLNRKPPRSTRRFQAAANAQFSTGVDVHVPQATYSPGSGGTHGAVNRPRQARTKTPNRLVVEKCKQEFRQRPNPRRASLPSRPLTAALQRKCRPAQWLMPAGRRRG
jgi:hypothetical protein